VTIPVVRGAKGGGKGGGDSSSSRTPVESPDSLRSKQYARIIDLVTEGEWEGLVDGRKSILLDGTPLQNPDGSFNFSGVTVESRPGTQEQRHIPGFPAVEVEVNVSTEVTHAQPLVRRITDPNVDAVRVTISTPRLTLQDTSTGDLKGSSIRVAVDVQLDDSGFREVITDTISGKTTSRYQRSYLIPLSGEGPWDIRLRRITADSTASTLQNQTWWESYTEVVNAKLRYPNSALVALQVDASQFSSIPTRAYRARGLKIRVPSNYDPVGRSYDGLWDGQFKIAWSNNPAWVYYDLLLSERYGLGEFVSAADVDKWALYQIARYCDELVPDGRGGQEPRFTCNLYLQTREEAFKVITNLASVFRAICWWGASGITAVQDAPGDVIAVFGPSNIIDGVFRYSGTSRRARHSVALVTWNNPDNHCKQEGEYVDDDESIRKWGIVETEVVAMGSNSQGQAHRFGKHILVSERLESETVSFRVGLEGSALFPGAVIGTMDPSRSGVRNTGRLIDATLNQVTLDASVTLEEGESYQVYLHLPDGKMVLLPVSSAPGVTSVLDLGVVLEIAPEPMSVWVLVGQDIDVELWRIVSLAEVDKIFADVVALAHAPQKYQEVEQNIKLEPKPTSVITVRPAAVSDLMVVESTVELAPSAMGIRATISWSSSEPRFNVGWRRTNGNWERRDVTTTTLDIEGLAMDDYEFEVVAINALGNPGDPVSTTYSFSGKDIPPADVDVFTVQVNGGMALFRWSQVANTDLAGYEIRYNPVGDDEWDNGSTVTSTTRGTQITTGIVPPGNWTFLIKARDFAGNMSVQAARADAVIANPNKVVFQRDERLWWETGTLENLVVHPVNRYLVPKSTVASAGAAGWDTFDLFCPEPSASCTYETTAFDLGQLATLRFYGILLSRMGPGEVGLVDPDTLFSTTTDGITWSDYSAWDVGYATAKGFRFKVTLDPAIGLGPITQFDPTADGEYRVTAKNNVTVTTAGISVLYDPPFFTVPGLNVNPVSATPLIFTITTQDRYGFTGILTTTAGAASAGAINYSSRGV